jgi:hypothetical protein
VTKCKMRSSPWHPPSSNSTDEAPIRPSAPPPGTKTTWSGATGASQVEDESGRERLPYNPLVRWDYGSGRRRPPEGSSRFISSLPDAASSRLVTTTVTTGSGKAGQAEKRTAHPSRGGFTTSTLHLAAMAGQEGRRMPPPTPLHYSSSPPRPARGSATAQHLHLARRLAHQRLIGDGIGRRCHGVLPPEELSRDEKQPYAPDLAGQIWDTTTGRTPTTQTERKT